MKFLSKINSLLLRAALKLKSPFLKPYSQLYIVSDEAGWVLDEEARELKKIARLLGYAAHILPQINLNIPQAIHYTSQFSLLSSKIYQPKNRISIDYFHGKPEQGENFRKCFDALKDHPEIRMVRVSNKSMEKILIERGVHPSKIMRIPIGLNLEAFPPQTEAKKREVRNKLSIPPNAFVIGSFQKDGVGWKEGNEPKFIKGPDVFIKTIEKVMSEIPNLWVLLSGPSRGYVKNELDKLEVPYKHLYLEDYADIDSLYDALDLYLISSREEGGPKACLESLAKGIPLVTTAVGQCNDLIEHGRNGMMTAIEDAEGLAKSIIEVRSSPPLKESLVKNGFSTAKENSYESQLPLWKKYFSHLINPT